MNLPAIDTSMMDDPQQPLRHPDFELWVRVVASAVQATEKLPRTFDRIEDYYRRGRASKGDPNGKLLSHRAAVYIRRELFYVHDLRVFFFGGEDSSSNLSEACSIIDWTEDSVRARALMLWKKLDIEGQTQKARGYIDELEKWLPERTRNARGRVPWIRKTLRG